MLARVPSPRLCSLRSRLITRLDLDIRSTRSSPDTGAMRWAVGDCRATDPTPRASRKETPLYQCRILILESVNDWCRELRHGWSAIDGAADQCRAGRRT